MNDTPSTVAAQARAAQSDIGALVRDAQELLKAAAALTGEKADAMRVRGLGLFDTALQRMQQSRGYVSARGQDMARAAGDYVQEKPWRTLAAATAVGVVIGLLFRRG